LRLRNTKVDGFCLVRLEADSRKCFERTAGRGHTTYILPDIQLNDFISFSLSCIRHVNTDLKIGSARQRWRIHNQIVIVKRRIAEAKSEREERLCVVIYILVNTR